jgi:hypothetical protein
MPASTAATCVIQHFDFGVFLPFWHDLLMPSICDYFVSIDL